MAQVTPQMIRELRERTQAGMSDCKNALVEADGNIEAAVEIILKKGLVKVAKREGATAAEGEIRSVLAADNRSGILVEVNIQTDFAARNEKFKAFVEEVTQLATTAPSLEALLSAKMATGRTVTETRDELIATIGEKIDVRRHQRLTLDAAHGCVHSYVHMNGRIGVLLAASAANADVAAHEAFKKFVDDTAMQVAAMSPLYLHRSEVPVHEVDKQKEIYQEQLKGEGKPEQAWPKIIEGKVVKWYSEICLVDQISVIVNGKSVQEVCDVAAKEAGGEIKLLGFVRFELGHGLQRKEDNFAEEAKRMAGN